MASTFSLYILEESNLDHDALSAYTRSCRSGSLKTKVAFHDLFSNGLEFELGLRGIADAVRNPHQGCGAEARTHLVIISAHGVERTGTHLHLGDRKEEGTLATAADPKLDLRNYFALFRQMPARCVFYLSACYGGFPGPIWAICGNSNSMFGQRHTLVGPLVAICRAHVRLLQERIIQALVAGGNTDTALAAVVERCNKQWITEYHGPAVRVVKADGMWIPDQGVGGFAADYETRRCQVVAFRSGGQGLGCPRVVLGDETELLEVLTGEPLAALLADGASGFLGTWLDARVRVWDRSTRPSGIARGELAKVLRRGQPPGKTPRSPKHSHMWEEPQIELIAEGRVMQPGAVGICAACNWVTLSIELCGGPGGKELVVSALCHRAACPEHSDLNHDLAQV